MSASDVQSALVVGAGIMGHAIAQVFAQAGIEVTLVDTNTDILSTVRQRITSNLETLAEFGHVKADDIGAIADRVRTTDDLGAAAKDVDFVVEAVSEVSEVKKAIFEKLEKILPDEVIIASNTSGIDIFTGIGLEMKKPGRFVTAHWFAPPHIVPLVEIAPGPETLPETVEGTKELMLRLCKEPVVMPQFARSFIVNKIQNNIGLAVLDLLGTGLASPEDIDTAVKTSLGIRLPIVGVAQTMDFAGLDLTYDIIKSYGMENEFIKDKVEKGHYGAKTSKGMFDYGGRSEEEILKKRDRLYLKMLEFLKEIDAFDPV